MPRLTAWLLGAVLLAAASAAAAGPSLKIAVYGGTGNIGRRIVHEALARGHTVKIIVRDPAAAEHDARLTVVHGDVLDEHQVAQQIEGEDVVVCAVSFRKPPDFAAYRRAAASLVGAQRALGARAPRLIVVGGAGSLEVAPGVLLVDRLPAAYRGEVTGQKEALDYYRTASDVPWTYFSPARTIEPGTRTGKFRLGGDQLITDAKGDSRISMEDYAVAVIDEAGPSARALHDRLLSARSARLLLRLQLAESLARDAEGIDRRGHAGVDRHLQQRLHDLLARQAVAQGPLHVNLELVGPIERADHGEIDEAAVATRQALASPDRAPAVLGHELLQRLREGIGGGQRPLDVFMAQHGLADRKSALVEILVHRRLLEW